MEYKVAELEGALLDAAVATAEGRPFTLEGYGPLAHLAPSCWVHDGGPIIERERLTINAPDNGVWWSDYPNAREVLTGPTPLIAAMRAYVASKLGEVVQLP